MQTTSEGLGFRVKVFGSFGLFGRIWSLGGRV